MRVGFIYNIATEALLRERLELTLSDCDSIDTINEITRALESGGHSVIGLNADQQLPSRLVELRSELDMVFNIATGVYGSVRQSHVPAMLEYLRIPHTGSGVLAEAICQHKPTLKAVLAAHGLPTPPSQFFLSGDEPVRSDLQFPLIVKLPAEGGSLGLTYDSIVDNPTDLRTQARRLIADYGQGALAELYLPGREFTVAVLGNDPPYALPVAELLFFGAQPIRLDEPDEPTFQYFKQVTGQPDANYQPMESRSVAPADLPPAEAKHIQEVAIGAYAAIGCMDWARFDMRCDAQGQVYILDANLEPGVASDYVLPKCAYAAGWTYNELILNILHHAIQRYEKHPAI